MVFFQNHDEGSKRFRCMLCNTAFTTRGSLTTHTKKEHKGHKIFMCDTCGKKFQTHKTLDVHRRVVHEQVSVTKFIKLDLEHLFKKRFHVALSP